MPAFVTVLAQSDICRHGSCKHIASSLVKCMAAAAQNVALDIAYEACESQEHADDVTAGATSRQ